MSKVVLMKQDAVYSSDNGITLTSYAADEFYEVPDHVAAGLFRRGAAVPAKFQVGEPTVKESPPAEQPTEALPKIKLKGGSR